MELLILFSRLYSSSDDFELVLQLYDKNKNWQDSKYKFV